jgi:hypothetical protein
LYRFIPEHEYNKLKVKKNFFIKDSCCIDKFYVNDFYKLGFINILLPYTIEFYKNNKNIFIPDKVKHNFKDLCKDNDRMQQFIDEYIDITNDPEDIMSKDKFLSLYNTKYNKKFEWKHIMSDVKRLGLNYDRKKRCKSIKGVIIGIKENDHYSDSD